jgi:sugar diacid utilization regulator
MASLPELIATPALRSRLSFVVRPRSMRPVRDVAFAEDLTDVGAVEPGAIVLLSRSASAAAGGYRFEMALRLGRTRETTALVIAGDDAARVTSTAASVADHSGIAILATSGAIDVAQLAVLIARELTGGADVALFRAHAAVRAVEAHPADGRREALVEHAGAALGVTLRFGAAEPAGRTSRPIVVDGQVEGWLSAPPQDGELAKGLDIVLNAVVAGLGEAIASTQRAEELPIQSREEVLTELLASSPSERTKVAHRARSLGLPIDAWHVAVRVEIEPDGLPTGEAAGYEQRGKISREALQVLEPGLWHSARAGGAVVLVRMYPQDPGVAAVARVTEAMRPAVSRMRARAAGGIIRCGVGSAQHGPAGLVFSAVEAKAAVTAARASGRMNEVTPFDSVGLRRALVDWYASDVAQEAVTTVLAPLSRLDGGRGEKLIQTLHVYLDQQGSLTRTGEALNLHRNAVAYRIKQIFELLDIDPESPDDRLLVQLACRARELA